MLQVRVSKTIRSRVLSQNTGYCRKYLRLKGLRKDVILNNRQFVNLKNIDGLELGHYFPLLYSYRQLPLPIKKPFQDKRSGLICFPEYQFLSHYFRPLTSASRQLIPK